jgi:hypothetical protein
MTEHRLHRPSLSSCKSHQKEVETMGAAATRREHRQFAFARQKSLIPSKTESMDDSRRQLIETIKDNVMAWTKWTPSVDKSLTSTHRGGITNA